ncbi:MAG: pitrilysin family protein [Wolbachia sp.]|nr:pitrilysin family protein [Wolbachia sp.]
MFHKFFSFLFLTVLSFNYSVFSYQLEKKESVHIQCAKLNNGLDVYVVPNHRIPAVLHAVVYKVGGMDDPIGKAGLAHYFEHLMFETTGKFTDIGSTMSRIGAQFNAFTTREFTCYYELILKKDLPLAMEVEADRMGNFNVTQDKIDREKNIVLEERKMRFDNHPHNLLREEMNNAFYRTGYGKPVVGWESDINTFSQDDITRFHDNYYHSGNAMLLIVGDVEFDEIIELAKEKYGDIKPKPTVRYYPNKEPEHNASLSVDLRSTELKEPFLLFRYRVPVFECIKEVFAADLAVDILGSGKSSKLYKDLVLDKGIAVSAYTYYDSLAFSDGYVDIGVAPKSGVDLSIVEKEVESSINNFIYKGITSEELENAKYKYKVAQFNNLSSLIHIAYFYAAHLALNVPLDEIDISYSQVNNVNLEDVNNKVNTIFSSNKLIGRLLPQGDNSNENK